MIRDSPNDKHRYRPEGEETQRHVPGVHVPPKKTVFNQEPLDCRSAPDYGFTYTRMISCFGLQNGSMGTEFARDLEAKTHLVLLIFR